MAELLDELLARCRRGDDDAVAVLVKRFANYVLDLATALLQDEHLAEDAMQAAFVTALTRLDQLRTPAAFPGWLRQIVRTEANRILRARRENVTETRDDRVSAEPRPPEHTLMQERRQQVRDTIAALPPAARAAVQLFYLHEMKCDQVADRLRIPQGTVRRRLHDARKRLHAMLLGQIAPETQPREQPRRHTGLPL